MDEDRSYFEQRERIERAAAKAAANAQARRAHQELAAGYAVLAQNGDYLARCSDDSSGPSSFTILGQ
jgi:hypothetical protein